MTKEHVGHVASTAVNTTSSNDLKRMLNLNNDGTVTSLQIEDAILRKEEDKIMDEEITSLESNDRCIYEGEDDNIENAMVNVAIINSVVTHGESTSYVMNKSDSIPTSIVAHGNNLSHNQHSSTRYQLRQRSGDAMVPDGVGQVHPIVEQELTTTNYLPIPTSIAKKPSSKSIPAAKSNPKPPRAAKRKRSATGTVVSLVNHAAASVAMANEGQTPASFLTSKPMQIPSQCFNSITSVPNPLSNAIDTTHSQQHQTNTFLSARTDQHPNTMPSIQSSYLTNGVITIGDDGGVPYPLLSPNFESYSETMSNDVQINNTVDQNISFPNFDQKQRVTFTEPTESRDRTYSIDLDLALGFGDEQTAVSGEELQILTCGGRNRAYSFECFAFGINGEEPLSQSEHSMHGVDATGCGSNDCNSFYQSGGRPRGDSIVFDQLRPREDSLCFEDFSRFRADSIVYDNPSSRPRGDSIIYDPTSFQDGGILEQRGLYDPMQSTAGALVDHVDSLVDNLLNGVVTEPDPQVVTPVTGSVGMRMHAEIGNTFDASMNSIPMSKVRSVNSVLLQNQLEDITSNPTLACSTAIPFDILNKDGRIGIYLPEARRQRIARFHVKRKNRIWRKRIKYDCRKKLADSRPRIKGRFVKREGD